MLIIIMLRVRCCLVMAMVLLTEPLGLAGAYRSCWPSNSHLCFGALLGLISLADILMASALILIGQIHNRNFDFWSPNTRFLTLIGSPASSLPHRFVDASSGFVL